MPAFLPKPLLAQSALFEPFGTTASYLSHRRFFIASIVSLHALGLSPTGAAGHGSLTAKLLELDSSLRPTS